MALGIFRFDPIERSALFSGLLVGSTHSGAPELSADERVLLVNAIQDLKLEEDSPRRVKVWYSKKERRLFEKLVRSALDSDDTRLEASDRAALSHVLTLFERR